jgi:membrane-bound lytic murein transglycosylase B
MATTYSTATIAADRGQRSFSLSLDQFLAKRGGSAIVARGARAQAIQRGTLRVPPATVRRPAGAAIWGMETGFGKSRGNQNILSAVATLPMTAVGLPISPSSSTQIAGPSGRHARLHAR